MAVAMVVVVVMMWRSESEEVKWGSSENEINEARGGEDLVEELADGAADHDLAEGKGGEDLVERVFR